MNDDVIDLGDEVRDTVTGFQGIAIGRTTWMSGCDRIVVQPVQGPDDKELRKAEGFDVTMLEIVTKGKVKRPYEALVPEAPEKPGKPGGPQRGEAAAMRRF